MTTPFKSFLGNTLAISIATCLMPLRNAHCLKMLRRTKLRRNHNEEEVR